MANSRNKVELNTLTQVNNNERNFLTALNDNLKRIQAAINDTLSRSGVLPNQMEEVLDMNGKRIVNVGPAVNPTDVVTRQDIQNIIDAANAAIAQLDRLVEDGKIALMNYASEYIYPTCTAAVDACQLAQRKSEDAQGAAEAARDALLLNADYQAIVANLTTILALVNDIANLDAIAADLTNIDTVAGISSAVSAVADNTENINAVNANKANIDTVAGDKANIDTVAGNTSNINTVAGISSAVTTLAGISATLTALNDSLTAINGVYDDLTKINGVYADLPEVEAVYAALSDIGAVADALTTISSVAAALTTLANIEDNLTTLLAVGADLTNLDSIAADLTNLDSIANNLTEILQASTYASQAATSASNAQIWAEGTDQQVVPLGGSHSAKVWAQYVEEIIAGTRIFGGSFDASTATATLTSAAKAKLGTDDNTIVLTNDTTPITGYAANEAIEYVVTVDGTFAGITLKVNDILWSSGLSWYKIDNSETVIADATESTKGIAALATTAEAEAGANDTKIMTPLKTKQAIVNNILTGTTDPTSAISSFTGQRYLNTVTGDTFVNAGETVFPAVTHYDVVGSPTISDAYVMSGITNDNYVKMPYIWQPRGPWEVTLQYTPTTSVPYDWYKITGAQVDFSGHSFGSAYNHPQLEATTNGRYWDINIIVNSVTMTPNTPYWFKYGWTGSQYYVKMSTDGTTYTTIGTQNSTTNILVSRALYIGKTQGVGSGADTRYAKGTMDLSVCRIDENDALVWQAVTPSSTGPGWTKLSNASSVYTKSEVDTALADKQNTLTAGTNITIDSNNVISAAGEEVSLTDIATAGIGISFTDVSDHVASADKIGSVVFSDGKFTPSSSDYLQLTSNSISGYTGSLFTGSYNWAWTVKFKSPTDLTKMYRICTMGSATNNFNIWCSITEGTDPAGFVHLGVNTSNGWINVAHSPMSSGTILQPSTWYWVRISRDVSQNQYMLELSTDGTNWTVEGVTSSSYALYNTNSNFYISQVTSSYLPLEYDLSGCSFTSNYGTGIDWVAYAPMKQINNTGLINTATGSNLTIGSTSATTANNAYGNINIGATSQIITGSTQIQGAIAIGQSSKASASNATALGRLSRATGPQSIAIGLSANAAAEEAYQVGRGTNTNTRTLQVGFWDPVNERDVQYQLLDSSGKVPPARYYTMTGADGTNAGTLGAVPAPAATDNTKFLRGDGTWAEAGGGGSASYDANTGIVTL